MQDSTVKIWSIRYWSNIVVIYLVMATLLSNYGVLKVSNLVGSMSSMSLDINLSAINITFDQAIFHPHKCFKFKPSLITEKLWSTHVKRYVTSANVHCNMSFNDTWNQEKKWWKGIDGVVKNKNAKFFVTQFLRCWLMT